MLVQLEQKHPYSKFKLTSKSIITFQFKSIRVKYSYRCYNGIFRSNEKKTLFKRL